MSPTLYFIPESGPCRTAMMTAKLIGVNLKMVPTDLFKGEHLTPEFLKMNPMHTVPTMTDGDLVITESRVIMTYLAEKYGKDDSLYPKDVKKRALINQKIFFDMGTLYEAIVSYYRVIYFGSKSFDESYMPKIKQAFELLNTFLAKCTFTAGECLTVADVTIVSSVGTAIAVFDFDMKPYPNVVRWFNKMKSVLPDYKQIMEENEKKLRILVDTFKNKQK